MEKPFTIGFSRQGEMDYPIQYEIVYSETNQKAMFKWIKDNPQDIWRTYSNEPSTEQDIKKFSKNKIEQISMKPEQLRKGNLMINNADGSLIIVKAYDIYCLEEGMDSMIMQPIPSTEKTLLKIGVKNLKRINNSCFCVQYNEKRGHYEFCLLLNGDIKVCLNNFLFIHQLQNLYFALTGEDLTLKT